MFWLIDCNHFYVSCERLFRPDIQTHPAVVLSNNDGCIVARSPEAKAIGIPMGAPYFKWQSVLERHNAMVFSSNYSLYGDISQRIMSLIQDRYPQTEVYSIDESFVYSPNPTQQQAQQLKDDIWKHVGIPVSIGIAPTKTLAKVANRYAKKHTGVHLILDEPTRQYVLDNTPIEDVWGIGRRYAKRLKREHILTALQFSNASLDWIRSEFTVCGFRCARELQGTPCITLEQAPPPRKSMVYSRAFGKKLSKLNDLEGIVSRYAARLARKLQKYNMLTSRLGLSLRHPFGSKKPSCRGSMRLPHATNNVLLLTQTALNILNRVFIPNQLWAKAELYCPDLHTGAHQQLSLFNTSAAEQLGLQKAISHIHKRFGAQHLRVATDLLCSEGSEMKQFRRSPRYTTRLDELLCIQMDVRATSKKPN